ncbi:hypothetical protein BZG36_01237 [Bifiguratus adelaidae]|uniref:Thaumatin-like protein 1 n=1 Tax=Bifiguratus adelaidae TaxID=1938954 RepID=A0A261Y5X9_9FUNG|nr:hypothetical protein BZG36_01237 [Bifiguratus adelaidae]
MKVFTAVCAATLTLTSVASARTINIINQCSYTIWPAAFADGLPTAETGFELAAGSSKSLTVSDTLSSARFWARTGCNGTGDSLTCATGDCGGKMQCAGITGQSATLAELTLSAGGQDWYDISNVDGYSIPVRIQPTGSYSKVGGNDSDAYNCATAQCAMNANSCAPELVKKNPDGTSSCLSICSAINDPEQRAKFSILQKYYNDPNTAALVCCSCGTGCSGNCGCYTSIQCLFGCSPFSAKGLGGVCDSSKWPLSSEGKPYPSYLKDSCPGAYSWAFDDNTSTMECSGANYDITFCY